MTAINLAHFKNRLQSLSRQLFFEHGWRMPDGLRDRRLRSPTNVTLAEWQAAKRRGKNAIDQKALIQQCWAASDGRAGFECALRDHGYRLAKGDRRGHVIVCHDGEVFAVARAVGLRAKAVKERLGGSEDLPSVAEALEAHANDVRGQFGRMAGEARRQLSQERRKIEARRAQMIARHRSDRQALERGQSARWEAECRVRRGRFKTGMAGLWQRVTGARRRITAENEKDALTAFARDQGQRQVLIDAQLSERSGLETERAQLRKSALGLIDEMRAERDAILHKLSEARASPPRKCRSHRQLDQQIDNGPELAPRTAAYALPCSNLLQSAAFWYNSRGANYEGHHRRGRQKT